MDIIDEFEEGKKLSNEELADEDGNASFHKDSSNCASKRVNMVIMFNVK